LPKFQAVAGCANWGKHSCLHHFGIAISPRSLEELGDLDKAIGGKSLEMANGSQGQESSNYSSIEQSDGGENQFPASEFLAQATNFT
jgi:hypothetical protein